MSPRRQETPLPANNQPVRFYKFVALSFLCLTLALLAVIGFMSSKRAVITVTTKDDPIEIKETVTVGDSGPDAIEGTLVTTTVSLEQTFTPTGSKSEPAQAVGEVTLHNDTNAPQSLVATTRLLTPEGVLFRLKDKVTVPANGEVKASVHADQKGESGNIGPVARFTIPGLNEAKQKVIYGSSSAPMTGGIATVGVLSAADIEKAKKQFVQALEKKGQDELLAKHPDRPGVFSTIQSVVEDTAVTGQEVSSFTMKGRATVLGVFYNQDQVRKTAEKALQKHAIDDIGSIRTADKEPKVVFGDYKSDRQVVELTVHHNAVVTLNPESKQLQKMMFFGKSKEEVRRYLLALDHVYGVEVTFRPVWVGTVPYVPDHVQVVVKQVE